ncbi:MAG: hypothetical protein WBG71_08810 [Leeuwenhoekiella sp.]
MDSIAQTVQGGDLDGLIALYAYGLKITEFKNGEFRNDDPANEAFERSDFGSVKEVTKFVGSKQKNRMHQKINI